MCTGASQAALCGRVTTGLAVATEVVTHLHSYLGSVLGVCRPEGQLLQADGARKLDARLVARPKVEVQSDVRVVSVLQVMNKGVVSTRCRAGMGTPLGDWQRVKSMTG